MTEAEEVAETLLPHYIVWNKGLHWTKQGHSSVKIRDWVFTQMSAYESLTVMDNVADALIELVFNGESNGNQRKESC